MVLTSQITAYQISYREANHDGRRRCSDLNGSVRGWNTKAAAEIAGVTGRINDARLGRLLTRLADHLRHDMTIQLPPDIESSIQAAVHRGHFVSVDAVTEAASLLLERLKQEQPTPPAASQATGGLANKPIWEEILELTADVRDEEWDKLPTELAEQHDHYIYGTPFRPPTIASTCD